MANLFRVDLPDGMSSPKLNSQRRATVQYTVKNVSARPIDGRAILISLPISKPPSGPVEKGWVKIEGKTDRHFDVDKEETFPVTISVPEKSDPGNYKFRLDTVWVDKPDEGDAGPAVSFDVPKQDITPKKFPLWLIPVIVVVLAAVGVGVWLILRGGGGIKVPDLHGKTVDEATTALTAAKLTLDQNIEKVQGKPEEVDKVVDQKPAAGEKAKENDPVHLKVGAAPAPPPGGQTSFAASWVNDNTSTPSLTKLLITQSGNQVSVHAYGKCTPTDCDWGTQSGTVANGTATVLWDQGFVKRTMKLSLDSTGHLRSVMDSVYNDGRAPQHWVDTFHVGSAQYTPPGTPVLSGVTTNVVLATTTASTQTPFAATWVNDNASSPSLTKLVITQSGTQINVHAYGKCTPTDCDWGTRSGAVVSGTATVLWDQGFVKRTMKLSVDSTGHLRSVMDSVYTDARAPQHWVETFHKT